VIAKLPLWCSAYRQCNSAGGSCSAPRPAVAPPATPAVVAAPAAPVQRHLLLLQIPHPLYLYSLFLKLCCCLAPEAHGAALRHLRLARARRVIMPQTGPRPIYTAPRRLRVCAAGRPIFERLALDSGAPGSRPTPGMLLGLDADASDRTSQVVLEPRGAPGRYRVHPVVPPASSRLVSSGHGYARRRLHRGLRTTWEVRSDASASSPRSHPGVGRDPGAPGV